MKHLRWILMILFFVFAVIVVVQNHPEFVKPIQLKLNLLFFDEYRSPVITVYHVLIISFLVGIIAAGVCGIVERFQLKRQIKVLTKDVKEKDKELNSLRNLPVTMEDIRSEPPPDI